MRSNVRERVGGFFRNTVWLPRQTCSVCAAPVNDYERCFHCHRARQQWPGQLADVVMPLAYAYRRFEEHRNRDGRHQSEQHMWSYKNDQPGPGCVTDLTMLLVVALLWHRPCAEDRVGLPWQCWTVVPSSRRTRLGDHPLVRLAHGAGLGTTGEFGLDRVHLVASAAGDDRDVRVDRFMVQEQSRVAGRHVLLLEDTWVTGASAQSAALALRRAGASAVTVLCLARWMNENGIAGEREFFADLRTPYDALACPLSGRLCSGPFLTSYG